MSKFFEAVRKTEQDLGGMPLPFTPDEGAAQPIAPHVPAEPERDIRPAAASHPSAPAQPPAPVQPAAYRPVHIRISARSPILPFDGAHVSAAEHYRIIRTRIVQHAASPEILCVSSTSMGDGKTINALNIACSLALKHGTNALLVDVDLRRPQLAHLLGVQDSPGLSDVLAGTCSVRDAIVQLAELPSLHFLPAGRCPKNPAELLDSETWRNVANGFRKEFDFTVIDSPPVGVVADYDLIETVCDGVILVVRPGHTDRRLLRNGIGQMPKKKFLGVVVNCVEEWFLWNPHPSYYGSYYAKPE